MGIQPTRVCTKANNNKMIKNLICSEAANQAPEETSLTWSLCFWSLTQRDILWFHSLSGSLAVCPSVVIFSQKLAYQSFQIFCVQLTKRCWNYIFGEIFVLPIFGNTGRKLGVWDVFLIYETFWGFGPKWPKIGLRWGFSSFFENWCEGFFWFFFKSHNN